VEVLAFAVLQSPDFQFVNSDFRSSVKSSIKQVGRIKEITTSPRSRELRDDRV
jgi:hypothetical protein